MTLDAARIDLRKAFVEGMGYVALSRVKRLEALTLLGINKMALAVSPDALAIDQYLQNASREAAAQFAHLAQSAKKRSQTPPEAASKNSPWSERLSDMRKTHPNAFKPWRAEEDQQLKKHFKKGDTVKALSTMLGRQPGSIRARLKKHFGEDVSLNS